MPAGRPLKYTPEQINKKIDQYIKSCWRKKLDMYGNAIKDKETGEFVMEQYKPYTLTGFAVFADTSRETLLEYENREEFLDSIKRIKDICYSYAEDSLFVGKNPTGAIFNLKNNYGWKDKQEIETTGETTVNNKVDLSGLSVDQIKELLK